MEENRIEDYRNNKNAADKNAAEEMGRGIVKPSLGQTIRSLREARANVSSELSPSEKNEIDKTLSFVIEELERWQWTKEEWLSRSGKHS